MAAKGPEFCNGQAATSSERRLGDEPNRLWGNNLNFSVGVMGAGLLWRRSALYDSVLLKVFAAERQPWHVPKWSAPRHSAVHESR